ncbi:hypothetical protein PO124_04775 [Bacillus licheniformis]|nr:hypothetical protein [Bacillus licheniformis]
MLREWSGGSMKEMLKLGFQYGIAPFMPYIGESSITTCCGQIRNMSCLNISLKNTERENGRSIKRIIYAIEKPGALSVGQEVSL